MCFAALFEKGVPAVNHAALAVLMFSFQVRTYGGRE